MPLLSVDELTTMLAEAGATPAPPLVMAGVSDSLLDQSPAARKRREITRIANQYRWHEAITMFLDTKGVSHMLDLTEPQLDDLMGRMYGYIDAAEMGCSLPNELPAG